MEEKDYKNLVTIYSRLSNNNLSIGYIDLTDENNINILEIIKYQSVI